MIQFLLLLVTTPCNLEIFCAVVVLLGPGVVAFATGHPFALALTCWLLFSAVVDGMPKPQESSPFGYRWLYASLNLLAANTTRMFCALSPRFTSIFGKGPIPPETPSNEP